jgi:adenylylsulfate kinase
MFKETNKRSVVKGITWRVIATTTTILIVYFFFGRLDLAIAAGAIETVLKSGCSGRMKGLGSKYVGVKSV